MSQLANTKPVGQKQKRVVMTKLQKAAKNSPCMMQLPFICNNDLSTTVLAHSRQDDRGLSRKPHDYLAVNMCCACHDEYDGRTRQYSPMYLEEKFSEAWAEQVRWWLDEGLLK